MPHRILEVKHRTYPNPEAVASALSGVELMLKNMFTPFEGYVCPLPLTPGKVCQMAVPNHLETYLEGSFRRDGLSPLRNRYDLTYSPHLNYYANFGVVHLLSKKRVAFEIEFRPNYE
jgi:hypothetical protein